MYFYRLKIYIIFNDICWGNSSYLCNILSNKCSVEKPFMFVVRTNFLFMEKFFMVLLMAIAFGLSTKTHAQSQQTDNSKKFCIENQYGKFCVNANKGNASIEKGVEKAVNNATGQQRGSSQEKNGNSSSSSSSSNTGSNTSSSDKSSSNSSSSSSNSGNTTSGSCKSCAQDAKALKDLKKK